MSTRRLVLQLLLFAVAWVIPAGRTRAENPAYPPQASLDDIRQLVASQRVAHPRLLATHEQLAGLAQSASSDPLRRQLADFIRAQADLALNLPPIERKLEGRRLLSVSRQCIQRVLVLATAYELTGQKRYLDRCRREMLAAARFSDWHPEHFLDVAEMTFGLAIGYDWLYDQLDDASRKEIRTALVEKSLRLPFDTKYKGWVHLTNNWGQVCHGGLTIGALAVLEDEPDLAAKTIHNALENLPASMEAFAPDGGYPEGPGYWTYGTSYNVLLISALESALGTDFGLSHAPGFDKTGGFPALVCGPSGLFFNYCDGSSRRSPEPILYWFASRYNRPDWLRGERERWQNQLAKGRRGAWGGYDRLMPLALLWMKSPLNDGLTQLPLNWTSGGRVPIAVHRSSWNDATATFVGIKAGSPSSSHGHMDIGSFVLDCDGVRWAVDLGHEEYHGIESRGMDLWNSRQNSDRWKIFRLSNLGHNTLVINGQLQVANGTATIARFSGDWTGRFSIVDMSPVYRGQVNSAHRGIKLLSSGEVVIQDELKGLHPGSHVRWGMITPGVADQLGASAISLAQGTKKLGLRVLSPANASWQEIDTARPQHDWDSPNPGTRMVAFESTAPSSGDLTLTVVATPGSCQRSLADESAKSQLSQWGQIP